MVYQLKKASILVVDDMQPMLTLVTSLMKMFGFTEIYQASDPEEGLQEFYRFNPDIILTDWLMEPFTGIEMVRRIRNDDKSPNRFVPVIMMTGYSHKIRVEEARDVGVTEFLVKPFRAKDLYARIEQLIEKPRRFVDTGEFFGPDRRRRRIDSYEGSKRREADHVEHDAENIDMVNQGEAAEILKKLRAQAMETAKDKKK